MTQIIVLFNLQTDADKAAYEEWAKTSDMPAVRRLGSVDRFEVLRMEKMLSGESETPYEYVEIIELNSFDGFMDDVKTEAIQEAAKQFRTFADDPKFVVCESLED